MIRSIIIIFILVLLLLVISKLRSEYDKCYSDMEYSSIAVAKAKLIVQVIYLKLVLIAHI